MWRLGSSLLLAGALASTACASVQPWERGVLAQRAMDPEARDEVVKRQFLHKIEDVREGATGGYAEAGGGCGCH